MQEANRFPHLDCETTMSLLHQGHLPIVFLIQNNQYGNATPIGNSRLIENLSDSAKAYGFPGVTVDGNDIIEVYEVSKEFINRARSDGGPSLIEAKTYRLEGHSVADNQRYRPKGEVEEWWKRDPLPRYQKQLLEMGVITDEDVKKIDAEAKAEATQAGKDALEVPFITYEDQVRSVPDVI